MNVLDFIFLIGIFTGAGLTILVQVILNKVKTKS